MDHDIWYFKIETVGWKKIGFLPKWRKRWCFRHLLILDETVVEIGSKSRRVEIYFKEAVTRSLSAIVNSSLSLFC